MVEVSKLREREVQVLSQESQSASSILQMKNQTIGPWFQYKLYRVR